MSRSLSFAYVTNFGPMYPADYFAALEAARLTSTAEPDAPHAVPMSGGAEPAGAAKQ